MRLSVKTLLASIVDYAGLFPPAELNLETAIATYVQSKTASDGWMLGRFVLPVSQLDEFQALLPAFPLEQWSLSLLMSQDIERSLTAFQRLTNPNVAVTALEFSSLTPENIKHVLSRLPADVDAFFEIPFNSNLNLYLDVLRHTQASAKIRTGGTTATAFPSFSQLCQFILAFAEAHVSFKATAGLHHSLPANYRLTYKSDSPLAPMHGFLNVAILAAIAHSQTMSLDDALDLLQEDSIEPFQFTEDSISWRQHTLTLAEIDASRQQFFRSFGSCSFQEPIADLKALELIEAL